MKIPQSVRTLYQYLRPRYDALKVRVDALLLAKKEVRWHYEGRVKEEESFALKLETGRVSDPLACEDFFACTLVVENHARIAVAEQVVLDNFTPHKRRPNDATVTHLAPYSFDFDDLRLYVKWREDPAQKPSGLDGILFEVQIKTFLQHAWGIATHDFVYKSDDVDWSGSRIAYQVKAMLENAELSIGEARKLADSAMLKRIDGRCSDLRAIIAKLKERWEPERLPKDLRRLAQTLDELLRALRFDFAPLWAAVDEATAAGQGAATLNLSPHAAIVAALLRKHGPDLFKPLGHPKCRDWLFVPLEVDLPSDLAPAVSARIVRPKTPPG